jgi:putative methyltransferase (TIGR04325 family)
MAITLKNMIKLVTPPVFIHLVKRLRGNRPTDTYGLSGDYQSWDEAMTVCTGFDSEIILEKTKAALLEVKNGEAVYERDSVLFDRIQYAWPLLACLMWAAARAGGKLNVLDFGGSLGTTFFQNRIFLLMLPELRWNIVEQPLHVETGKRWFEDDHLRFYKGIEDCLTDTQPNVAILSGVLGYIEHPYKILEQVMGLSCECIILDRTSFWDGPTDRLCVQRVPPNIYPASFPSWVFSVMRFHSHLDKEWEVLEEFDSIDRLSAPVKVVSKGFILVRKNHHLGRIP